MAKASESFPELYHSNLWPPSISAIFIKCNLEQCTPILLCLHAKFHVSSCNTVREKCCVVLSACELNVSSCNIFRANCLTSFGRMDGKTDETTTPKYLVSHLPSAGGYQSDRCKLLNE